MNLILNLRKYLFEQITDDLIMRIQSEISDSIKFWLPFVQIQEIDLPHIDLSLPIYYVIAPAECSANLSRYDGVKFGYRCEDPKDLDLSLIHI